MARRRTAAAAAADQPTDQPVELTAEQAPTADAGTAVEQQTPPPPTAEQIVREVAEATRLPDQGEAAADDRDVAEERAAERPRGPVVGGRGWTERYVQPVKYRRFTERDQTGKSKIMFRFDLPPGQDKPDGELLDVIRAHKQTPEGYPTGLHFENDRVQGKVWKLPNDELGRATADSLDQALDKLAKKIEGHAATPDF